MAKPDNGELYVSLRMPTHLHDVVATEAIKGRRSMHAQILTYLEEATQGKEADPTLLALTKRPGRKKKSTAVDDEEEQIDAQ